MHRPSVVLAVLLAAATPVAFLVASPSPTPGKDVARDTTAVAPAAAPTWQPVFFEGFEGIFPGTGGWNVVDYNGPNVGTKPAENAATKWDDTPVKARHGFYSAHPNDWSTYSNQTDTWMRQGPISLANATNARLRFWYWLETEPEYDSLTVSYACPNRTSWTSIELSGQIGAWRKRTVPMKDCAGRGQVFVRFWFRSDYSGAGTAGVFVDDIVVEEIPAA